ncbi:hypothetical protein [Amorphus sp. MBR-141]
MPGEPIDHVLADAIRNFYMRGPVRPLFDDLPAERQEAWLSEAARLRVVLRSRGVTLSGSPGSDEKEQDDG